MNEVDRVSDMPRQPVFQVDNPFFTSSTRFLNLGRGKNFAVFYR